MRVLTAIDRDEIAALRDQDEYVWVDLVSPAPQELEEAIEVFQVHELAAKALREDDDHPWLEVFDESGALVFYGVSDPGEVFEVEIAVTGDSLLTVRHAACTPVDQVRNLLSRRQPD